MHGAAFFYHRIHVTMAEVLLHLKALGINTIDLYPLWNWQQPEENVLDFDGHTNPRRDLKYLLRLIALMDFKLTFGPAPISPMSGGTAAIRIGCCGARNIACRNRAFWRGAIRSGTSLQYDKSEEAATEWLKNQTTWTIRGVGFTMCLPWLIRLLAENGWTAYQHSNRR